MTEAATPRGREAVMDALVDAAATLFAARGPADVSVRDIASHAGVNHGLVHRHFGSKSALLRAVMTMLAREIAAAAAIGSSGVRDVTPAFFATAKRDRYWRVLARALLDGEDPRSLQDDFPVVEKLVAQLTNAQRRGALPQEMSPRVVAAMSIAMGLGWLVFEPYLYAATGLGNANEQTETDRLSLRQEVFATWRTMLAALR